MSISISFFRFSNRTSGPKFIKNMIIYIIIFLIDSGPDFRFENLKKLIEVEIFGRSSPRQPLRLDPLIILHYSISILDGFEPDFGRAPVRGRPSPPEKSRFSAQSVSKIAFFSSKSCFQRF